MKKLAAILLLAIFAFNTVGYRFLFDLLETNADATFTAKLDEGKYDTKDLITVKVPINVRQYLLYKRLRTHVSRIKKKGNYFFIIRIKS